MCTAPHVRVRVECKVGAPKYEPGGQTVARVFELIKEKSAVYCAKPPLPPHSLTKELLQEVTKEFSSTFQFEQTLVVTPEFTEQQQTVLGKLGEVLSNPVSLSLSFRSGQPTADFLVSTPDFDFPCIDQFTALCIKNPSLHERVLAFLVVLALILRKI